MAVTLEDVMERLEAIEHEVKCLRQAARPIPLQRKYTRKQAAFRLTHGQDPSRVPEGEEKEQMRADAYGVSWVADRLADDDCLLSRTSAGITERAIQRYEKHL